MASIIGSLRRPSISGGGNGDHLERKNFDKIISRLEHLHRLCSSPDFCLPKTAPNILNTLSDLIRLIWLIVSQNTGSKFTSLCKNLYMIAFIRNLEERVKQFSKHLSDNKSDVSQRGSPSQKDAVTIIVRFSYIFNQLNTIFPNGEYRSGDHIQNLDARKWWKDNFKHRLFVSWNSFLDPFCSTHDITGPIKKQKFMNEINLCRFKYISVFEFDVFSRLFSPWGKLSHSWYELTVLHPGYLHCATYEDVSSFLDNYKGRPGTYVFRMSCTTIGKWSIGYVKDDGEIAQTVVRVKTIVEALIDGKNKEAYRFPGGQMDNPDLTELSVLNSRKESRVRVTSTQFDEYGNLGNTFEVCKICQENDKDTKLEPCSHLLCRNCITNWMLQSQECPFCRTTICSTSRVILEPYTPCHQSTTDGGVDDSTTSSGSSHRLSRLSISSTHSSSSNHCDSLLFAPTMPTPIVSPGPSGSASEDYINWNVKSSNPLPALPERPQKMNYSQRPLPSVPSENSNSTTHPNHNEPSSSFTVNQNGSRAPHSVQVNMDNDDRAESEPYDVPREFRNLLGSAGPAHDALSQEDIYQNDTVENNMDGDEDDYIELACSTLSEDPPTLQLSQTDSLNDDYIILTATETPQPPTFINNQTPTVAPRPRNSQQQQPPQPPNRGRSSSLHPPIPTRLRSNSQQLPPSQNLFASGLPTTAAPGDHSNQLGGNQDQDVLFGVLVAEGYDPAVVKTALKLSKGDIDIARGILMEFVGTVC